MIHPRHKINSIIVLGGGTAGWLAAGYFSSQLHGVKITVIESGEEKIIGVGETTVPQIRHHLEKMGLDENTWMRETGAVFKYGSRFVNWKTGNDERIHGFSDFLTEKVISRSPNEFNKNSIRHERDSTLDLDYWINLLKKSMVQDDNKNLIGIEAWHFIKNNLAHRDLEGHQYFSRVPGYAYNLDAFRFGSAIRKLIAEPNGVERIVAHIAQIKYNEDDSVHSLIDSEGKTYAADLYIDCTGFRRLLIGRYSRWISKEKRLGKKAVVAGRVSYQDDQSLWCTPALHSTALKNGWSWRISLRDDMGSGYVYNTDYIDQDQAEEEFRRYWASNGKEVDVRVRTKFDSGFNEKSACKNVIAAGLANNFLEPLEATSISFSALINELIVDVLNKHQGTWSYRDADTVSRLMTREIDYSADFLWMHYALTQRNDTQFWRDQGLQRQEALSIAHKWFMDDVDIYRREKDFGHTRFNKFDWALMLTTMDAWHECPTRSINDKWLERAEIFYKFKKSMVESVGKLVPTHWDLIKSIND
jgi:tryptophan 7-halogenase